MKIFTAPSHCSSEPAGCAHESLSTATGLLCSGLVVLGDNIDASALARLGAIAVALAQDLFADDVVDLCQDALKGQLYVGGLQSGGLDERQALLLTEALQRTIQLSRSPSLSTFSVIPQNKTKIGNAWLCQA